VRSSQTYSACPRQARAEAGLFAPCPGRACGSSSSRREPSRALSHVRRHPVHPRRVERQRSRSVPGCLRSGLGAFLLQSACQTVPSFPFMSPAPVAPSTLTEHSYDPGRAHSQDPDRTRSSACYVADIAPLYTYTPACMPPTVAAVRQFILVARIGGSPNAE
jgi:hypothetical protein